MRVKSCERRARVAALARLSGVVIVTLATSTTWGLGDGAARADARNPDGTAVTIGNRHYAHQDVPDVDFAHRDTHLHLAAHCDGVDFLVDLVAPGSDVNARIDGDSWMPLHVATKHGAHELMAIAHRGGSEWPR